MQDATHVYNGRFETGSDNWDLYATAGHIFTDGFEQAGCIRLPAQNDYIEQDFTVPRARQYTLHFAVKGVGAALGDGDFEARIYQDATLLYTLGPDTVQPDIWEEANFEFGLAPGNTFTLQMRLTGTTEAMLDDIWLWFIPMSRGEIAAYLADKMGALASDLSLSAAPSANKPEGDYTWAIDTGLRNIGAINPETGKPDIRYVGQESIATALDMIERQLLEGLQRQYSSQVDVRTGPIQESLSQKAAMIGKLVGGGSGQNRVVMRRLARDRSDWPDEL